MANEVTDWILILTRTVGFLYPLQRMWCELFQVKPPSKLLQCQQLWWCVLNATAQWNDFSYVWTSVDECMLALDGSLDGSTAVQVRLLVAKAAAQVAFGKPEAELCALLYCDVIMTTPPTHFTVTTAKSCFTWHIISTGGLYILQHVEKKLVLLPESTLIIGGSIIADYCGLNNWLSNYWVEKYVACTVTCNITRLKC